MALKGALGEEGAALFADWSAQAAKNDPTATAKAWASFKPARIGAGTIYHLAMEKGWRPDPDCCSTAARRSAQATSIPQPAFSRGSPSPRPRPAGGSGSPISSPERKGHELDPRTRPRLSRLPSRLRPRHGGAGGFRLATGTFDLRPFNLYALIGAAGGVVSSALASLALWRGWGRK